MPGTHRTPPDEFRTPPDEFGDRIVVEVDSIGAQIASTAAQNEFTPVPADALPELIAHLAAHLSVDARRALTRYLAAQDGDAVIDVGDAWSAVLALGGVGSGATSARIRAALDAARAAVRSAE